MSVLARAFVVLTVASSLVACASSRAGQPADEDGGVKDASVVVDAPAVTADAGAGFGEPCEDGPDCASGDCYRPDPGQPGHCTLECNGNCPDGYACRTVRIGESGDRRLCVPADDTFCQRCDTHEQCGDDRDACVQLTDGTFCTIDCYADPTVCPAGFSCQIVHGSDEFVSKQCMPINGLCCIDADGDRHGVGDGCLGADCDDHNPVIYDGAPEVCDGYDNDCDLGVDNDPIDCAHADCELGQTGYYERAGEPCNGVTCVAQDAMQCGLYTCSGGGELGDECAVVCDVEDDGKCIDAAHCDASHCLPDLADGQVCDEASDCASGHCQNGFCCPFGDCCRMASDCPTFGTRAPVCDNPTACQGTRGEAVCNSNYVCGTDGVEQDDSACGPIVVADDCGLYREVHCTGGRNQSDPPCPTTCHGHADCDDVAWCDPVSDTCAPDLDDGESCGDDDERCRSGHCQNGFCCASGDCCATAQDCPGRYSTPPTCPSPEACDGEADVAVCTDSTCHTAQHVDDDSACGPTVIADDCGAYRSIYCTGASTQTAPHCPTSCTGDSECDSDAYCDGGHACVPDEPDGGSCSDDGECQSGHCNNGHCCASGMCCAAAGDCDSFDRAPVCDTPATCQGSRVEGACTATFQCDLHPPRVADDSGCASIEASDCGPYPARICTGMTEQTPPVCPSTCSGDSECDVSAHCDDGHCEPDQGPGGYCDEPSDCNGGLHCVDDVCCNTACNGACEACDLPGSMGTCSAVPGGQDPDNECGQVSCAGYYAGWSGDNCLGKADVPANVAACNGARACRSTAVECGAQTQAGGVTTHCHDQCQDPTTGTCTGTVAGTCSNVNPGTQTCGVGQCQRTAPQCQNGAPATCTPGQPVAESCNDLDDNCNGTIDDGAFSDAYEPNPDCNTSYQLGTVQSDQTNTYTSMTVYGSGDYDYYRVTMEENDNSCGCGFPNLFDEDYLVTIELEVPPGGGSYELCMKTGDCGFGGGDCVEIAAGQTGQIQRYLDGACPGNDTYDVRLRVRGDNAPGFECRPYRLSYTFDAGYCRQ